MKRCSKDTEEAEESAQVKCNPRYTVLEEAPLSRCAQDCTVHVLDEQTEGQMEEQNKSHCMPFAQTKESQAFFKQRSWLMCLNEQEGYLSSWAAIWVETWLCQAGRRKEKQSQRWKIRSSLKPMVQCGFGISLKSSSCTGKAVPALGKGAASSKGVTIPTLRESETKWREKAFYTGYCNQGTVHHLRQDVLQNLFCSLSIPSSHPHSPSLW